MREVDAVGPDMVEVARRLDIPFQKVSREYRSKVEKNNFVVTPRLNREAIGLRTLTAVVDLTPRFAASANDLFAGLDNLWYMHNFVRTHPDGRFILQFTIPEEHVRQFPELLERMTKLGLVTKVYKVFEFTSRYIRPMSAEYFDFRTGRWRFDWAHLPAIPPRPIPRPTPRQRFSLLDLKVLYLFMMKCTTPVEEIAKIVRIDPGTAKECLRHIAGMHLTNGYVLYWPKEQWNPESGGSFTAAHKYVMSSLSVERATEEERDLIREKLNRIPTLWGENFGRDYYAEVAIPPDQLIEGIDYLRKVLAPVADRSRWYMLDPKFGFSFPPPRKAFDGATGEWVYDLDEQTANIKEQMRVVSEEARLPKQEVT